MVTEVANPDFLEMKIIQAKWLLRDGQRWLYDFPEGGFRQYSNTLDWRLARP
jgi:hypothetical protein